MRDGHARVYIATDVAARGIDLPGLDLIIHADLPTNPDTLLHRSGRTGQAGRKGISTLIVPLNARRRAERLLENASIKAEWARPPSSDDVNRRDNKRLLADPLLSTAVEDEERALVDRLLAATSPETLAAAFIGLSRANPSAPEERSEVSVQEDRGRKRERDASQEPDASPKRPREEFGPSVWFSLSVGRKQNAEPRWLILMLCRNGKLTKHDIAANKIQPDKTYIRPWKKESASKG